MLSSQLLVLLLRVPCLPSGSLVLPRVPIPAGLFVGLRADPCGLGPREDHVPIQFPSGSHLVPVLFPLIPCDGVLSGTPSMRSWWWEEWALKNSRYGWWLGFAEVPKVNFHISFKRFQPITWWHLAIIFGNVQELTPYSDPRVGQLNLVRFTIVDKNVESMARFHSYSGFFFLSEHFS